MSFIPGVDTQATPYDHPDAPIIALRGKSLISSQQASLVLPTFKALRAIHRTIEQYFFLGTWQGDPCFTIVLGDECDDILEKHNISVLTLRSQLDLIDESLFHLCGAALQVVDWDKMHQYCSRCGQATKPHPRERARECEQCAVRFYPRISPCVIGLVAKGNECLLAHNVRFSEPRYSVLAGFIEAGESAEQAFAREVREEVGIEIHNIRYFKSQAWPFPGQLMLGFTADYLSGEIKPDGVEVDDANWYAPNNFPLLPPPGTISGQLITDFVQRTQSDT